MWPSVDNTVSNRIDHEAFRKLRTESERERKIYDYFFICALLHLLPGNVGIYSSAEADLPVTVAIYTCAIKYGGVVFVQGMRCWCSCEGDCIWWRWRWLVLRAPMGTIRPNNPRRIRAHHTMFVEFQISSSWWIWRRPHCCCSKTDRCFSGRGLCWRHQIWMDPVLSRVNVQVFYRCQRFFSFQTPGIHYGQTDILLRGRGPIRFGLFYREPGHSCMHLSARHFPGTNILLLLCEMPELLWLML